MLREPHRVGLRAPMKHCIQVLKDVEDDDVVSINRTWLLLCMALVLSPGTGNMVPLEYLASLVDMDKIDEFAWDGHFLVVALKEVKKYQRKREAGKRGFWIGGCLPMFAIIYMDFVYVTRVLVSEHRIDYSLPRACFVCNKDFDLVEEIDKNKLKLDKIEFGKRNLRRLPETPYVSLEGYNEADRENNTAEGASGDANIPEIPPSKPVMDGSEIGGDVCGSLDEWLHPLPSSQELTRLLPPRPSEAPPLSPSGFPAWTHWKTRLISVGGPFFWLFLEALMRVPKPILNAYSLYNVLASSTESNSMPT